MTGYRAASLLLNEEQKMLSKTARDFVRGRAPVGRLRAFRDSEDEAGFSRELWSEMAELGWLGLQVPGQYGGLGLGFFDLCVLLEESGRQLMPEPFASTLLLGAQALVLGGTEAQKTAWLSGIATGEKIVTLAYSEIGSPESAAAASNVGGRFALRGEVDQVLDAHVADAFIVATTSNDGVTLFLVDPAQPGVELTRQHRIDGLNAAIVHLRGVSVGADSIVGGLGDGGSLLGHVLDRARIGSAAQMLGAAEQAFADTLEYLKTREQFGAPIGSFQALQHRAVSVFTQLALTRSAVLAAARAVDDTPQDVPRLASLAKAMASETFVLAAKEGIQMHGGIGVTDEHDIGFYIKRAQAAYVSLGAPSHHRRRWAELHGY